MQVADGKRLFHVALPTALLAQPWANPSKGRGQRQIVGDNLRRLRVVGGADPRYEAGDVQPGRTASLARPDAVTGVVGEQEFKRGLTCRPHFFRIINHDHSLRSRRGAGRPEIGPPFDLHRAQKARGGWLKPLDMAQRWDRKAEAAR